MLTLDIRFNLIVIYHHGVSLSYRGDFSNSRMIVADWQQWLHDLQAVLQQAAQQGIYTPPKKLTGNLLSSPICLNVCEPLADGLSPLEYKCLYESLASIQAKGLNWQSVLYQGTPVLNKAT